MKVSSPFRGKRAGDCVFLDYFRGHFGASLPRLGVPSKLLCFNCRQNSNTSRLFQSRTENGTSMKIHEYQAKAILARYGVTTPRGEVVFTKDEAREAAHRLRSHVNVIVVKAQIHSGGRGKAGGVKLARSSDEAGDIASHILGMNLVTPQTGPAGRRVKRLLIEEGLDIKRELYLGLLVDRATGRVVFMASAAGGMEIEEVAKENPGAILREAIHPAVGLQPYQTRKIAFGLGLPMEVVNHATPFLQALYRAFIDTDAS